MAVFLRSGSVDSLDRSCFETWMRGNMREMEQLNLLYTSDEAVSFYVVEAGRSNHTWFGGIEKLGNNGAIGLQKKTHCKKGGNSLNEKKLCVYDWELLNLRIFQFFVHPRMPSLALVHPHTSSQRVTTEKMCKKEGLFLLFLCMAAVYPSTSKFSNNFYVDFRSVFFQNMCKIGRFLKAKFVTTFFSRRSPLPLYCRDTETNRQHGAHGRRSATEACVRAPWRPRKGVAFTNIHVSAPIKRFFWVGVYHRIQHHMHEKIWRDT